MIKYFKFLFQKFTSAKYVVTGKCKACGNCCKNITFKNGEHFIETQEQFDCMRNFDKRYNIFEISGRNKENNALLFKCKYLNNNGKCSKYWLRSLACRNYPKPSQSFIYNNGQLLDGCGYKIEKTKIFADFIK